MDFLHWWCFSHFGDIFYFWILFFLIGDKSRQNGYRFSYFGDYIKENGDNQHDGDSLVKLDMNSRNGDPE